MSEPAVTTATQRQRHPPEVRRRMILDAARVCITERGLANTTVREIAARAGVSSGTVTHHFASIDEILMEVLRAVSTRFTEDVLGYARAAPSTIEQLHRVIDANLPDQPEALQAWKLWLDYWARAAHDERVAAVHSERHAYLRRELAHLIREGGAAREFGPVDAEDVAAEFLGLLDGLGLQAALGDAEMPVDRARHLLRSLVASRLGR